MPVVHILGVDNTLFNNSYIYRPAIDHSFVLFCFVLGFYSNVTHAFREVEANTVYLIAVFLCHYFRDNTEKHTISEELKRHQPEHRDEIADYNNTFDHLIKL